MVATEALDAAADPGKTGGMIGARAVRPAGCAALALAALIGISGCRGRPSASASPPAPEPVAAANRSHPPAPTGGASTGTRPSAGATPGNRASASVPPAPVLPLRIGSQGPDVVRLQQQLTALGYWSGAVDGRFGDITQQAVFALQKAAGQRPSGQVTATTQAAIRAGTRPAARSRSGRMIEVNLARGLLLFVTDGHVDQILNTSTGGGYVYYDHGMRNVARTPKGHFTTYRVVDGPDRSSLGLLIRPRYFTGGYAIHGDSEVPAYPVSHGCVRVSDAAIDWIWSANLDPVGATVWIY